MTHNDPLGDRMKAYEAASSVSLSRRLPVIIRLDGRAFHTYTRKCDRPFDPALHNVMVMTALEVCQEVQGAELAYVQSDEISVLVHGYKKFDSQPWFDNKVQKICSVSAAIASATFTVRSSEIFGECRPASFDARCFVLPEADVCNYFVWRQKDAIRNSIQSLARSIFSQKQLHKKSTIELTEMCEQKGHAWRHLELRQQRGTCVVKLKFMKKMFEVGSKDPILVPSNTWSVDPGIPIFSENRAFIEDHLTLEEE